jgi:hypothetical protein
MEFNMTKDEALKMAIEHIERGGATTERKVVINACKEALDTEQVREDLPAQEPVAWMNVSKDAGFKQVTVFQEPTSKKSIPLYPHPHQWQGLTDDEIGRLAVFDGLHHVEIPLLAKFILAIEQALKEKNNAV